MQKQKLVKEHNMEKIYGYKEKDVLGLAEFIKNRGNASLSSVFEKYGLASGKAKGTVRNLYYALAKFSSENQEFCDKYLDGKPLKVSKIIEFNKGEEKELVKKILIAKSQGKSCRSEILSMADGDGKIALRYQNKFRNAVKNKRLISEIVSELEEQGVKLKVEEKEKSGCDIDFLVLRIKTEISEFLNKRAEKTKKEKDYLRARVNFLEQENLKLYNLLYGEKNNNHAIRFFQGGSGENALN